MTRTCSPVDLGLKCQENQSPTGGSLKVCHEVCVEDGCNGVPFGLENGAAAFTACSALLAPLLLLIHRVLP
jgi:hypothetical protein